MGPTPWPRRLPSSWSSATPIAVRISIRASAAASFTGVSVVSMSWGCGEFNGESTFDGHFTTPDGHQGVTFVASAGDSGSPGMYPAYSPNVVAVGRTLLTLSGGNSYGGETAWSNGGGGISLSEPEPAYQRGVQGTGMRTIPDISFDADPTSGVSVYDSYNDTTGHGPWKTIGGTSLGHVLGGLDRHRRPGTRRPGAFYARRTRPDVAGPLFPGCGRFSRRHGRERRWFHAGPGYDETTGLGSPVADIMISDLASYNIAPRLAVTAGPPGVVAAGQSFGLTVQVARTGWKPRRGIPRSCHHPAGGQLRGRLPGRKPDRDSPRWGRYFLRIDTHACR